MPVCNLRYSDNVWFTDYRPDKVRVKCAEPFNGVEIHDNIGGTILNINQNFDANTWYEFNLTFNGPANGGGQYDIERVTLRDMNENDNGYLQQIEFGPQEPTEHPM